MRRGGKSRGWRSGKRGSERKRKVIREEEREVEGRTSSLSKPRFANTSLIILHEERRERDEMLVCPSADLKRMK